MFFCIFNTLNIKNNITNFDKLVDCISTNINTSYIDNERIGCI